MKKSARFVVKGTVQGVFYRQFVKEHADSLSLRGFVRNMETGEVEVVVEGDGESVERIRGFLLKGPQHSQIRDVQVTERKWSGDFDEFKILRF